VFDVSQYLVSFWELPDFGSFSEFAVCETLKGRATIGSNSGTNTEGNDLENDGV
jgi:hypothetical protein